LFIGKSNEKIERGNQHQDNAFYPSNQL